MAPEPCSSTATLPIVAVTIPQRELRNQIGDVLRRAERGERFTITVGGRPVAELGPLASVHKPAAPGRLAAILAEAPVDTAWATQLRQMREEDVAVARDTWPLDGADRHERPDRRRHA
jgi:prevent-host-death family protein